jgi:hypothetical protein
MYLKSIAFFVIKSLVIELFNDLMLNYVHI